MSADSAVKDMTRASALAIIEDEKERFKILIAEANSFLGQYENIIGNYKEYKTIFESDLITPNDKATLLYKEMKKDAELTRSLTKIQFQLEAVLNAFLGRKIYLTWVDQKTGDFILKNEDTLLDTIITREVGRKGAKKTIEEGFIGKIGANEGRGNVSIGAMRSMKGDPIADFSEDIQNQIKSGTEKWKPVYNEAIKRFNKIASRKKKYNPFFYYDESKSWNRKDNHSIELPKAGGRGRIAEAYIKIIMAPREEDKDAEKGISAENLKRLNNYIEVENVDAAIKGDVVLGSDSSIHFAVKTGKFSTAMFGQYYRLANNISEIGKKEYFLTKEELTNYLGSFADDAEAEQKIEELAGKEASEAVGEAIAEVSK